MIAGHSGFDDLASAIFTKLAELIWALHRYASGSPYIQRSAHADCQMGQQPRRSPAGLGGRGAGPPREGRGEWPDTREFLAALKGLRTVQPLSVETHETALALAQRYGLSIDDAMIAAAALEAGCDVLWSEDMPHGLVLDERLRILNPFMAEG